MEGILGPREASKFISENSSDVKHIEEGISKFAKTLLEKVKTGRFSVKIWRQHELNPQTKDEDAINWVFVSAVLNFSFWSEKESLDKKYVVSYKGKPYTGYWALCAALNRALDEGIPITTASYYSTVDLDTANKIFRSDSTIEMPLMEERVKALNDAGKLLMQVQKYQGNFVNVLKEANKSSQSLLRLVLQHFESFRDVGEYCGKKVGFYKRAQILIGDLWGCCEGEGLGQFEDIDTLTIFADYRIPQALVYFGVMEYSKNAMDKLEKEQVLQSGEKLEVEIRGVSIWACELIRDKIIEILNAEGNADDYHINAVLLDHYIWDTRRDMADKMQHIPFHRCRGIYY